MFHVEQQDRKETMSKGKTVLRREKFKGLHKRHNLWRWFFSSLVALAFLLFMGLVWFNAVSLGNDSMAPTLSKGDVVLVDRVRKYLITPKRTDLIAFKNPETGEMLIKRVAALEGETISGRSGCLWIDGKYRLEESDYSSANTPDFEGITVPEGCVFVLSDDRSYGEDSREEAIGCIPVENIIGIVNLRLLKDFALLL